jgi:hypothetical protein
MHRKSGNDADYIIHLRPWGASKERSSEKIQAALEALLPLGPVAYGSSAMGSSLIFEPQTIMSSIRDGQPLHVTFDCFDKFAEAIKRIVSLDLRLSCAVSAPFDSALEAAEHLGLEIKGLQLDLGEVGALSRANAVPGWILELISLCGHMRLSIEMVKHLAHEISLNKITAAQAAAKIGKSCRCGCFNTTIAEKIFSQAIRIS